MPDQPSSVPPVSPAAGSYDRTVFFVSDGTGITAETFGHSVLTQFESAKFRQIRIPFIDTLEKAQAAVARIDHAALTEGRRPIIFSTLVNAEINAAMRLANALFLDLIQTFVEPLEAELSLKSTHSIGRSHIADTESYKNRIEAINFSLAHDDGQTSKGLADADVILVGVSRCGKTPTSLYLAMQYGIKAANYPLIPEDFERNRLPGSLSAHKSKIFGLSITPERLHEVRQERRPNSKYASLENCRYEVAEAEKMMRIEDIRWLSSTTKSIEEIATTILQQIGLERRVY